MRQEAGNGRQVQLEARGVGGERGSRSMGAREGTEGVSVQM